MSTLFSNNSEGGYRLRSLEIFNWGTFNGNIYTLKTEGRTSLLTGANGSGKTTLIDAILTLLVPSHKRFYNQSSGTESKKDRDENSYFWGCYGKTYSEQDERSKTEQLRNKSDNPYSVLLGCFQNTASLHTITLVQVRWFSNGGLKKVFIVSPYPLNINDHFGKDKFDLKGDWKKKLQKQFPKTDLFESFKDYSARFSDLFGLKEKALSLFNQTVGIKVLGDLTQFIRQQMLEEAQAEDQFKNLYDHYNDLLLSHKAIQKDEKQLELLKPVIENKEQLSQEQARLNVLTFVQEQLPFFLNKAEYELLQADIDRIDKEVIEFTEKNRVLEIEISDLDKEKTNLITQKAALNIDAQITLLSNNIDSEIEKRNRKQTYHTDYVRLAGKLNLQTSIDETTFKENTAIIESLMVSTEDQQEELRQEKFRLGAEKQKIDDDIIRTQERIESLLKRKNRIPEDLIKVRSRLVELLETGEDELPFVGELIRVKEDALHWEDSIEKLLRGFSLRLLVPEKYNKQVNQFVYTNNLQTKLIYERIDRRQSESIVRWPVEDDAMLNKTDIRENGIYSKWLEHQLVERFNYYCTDDLDVFYNSPKAITSNGLIRNVNRHEKDDRPFRSNKKEYTLGWDNKTTVQYLQQEKLALEKQGNTIFKRLQAITPLLSDLKEKANWINHIEQIKFFSDIDWHQHASRIEDLNRQIETLKGSSDKYKTIIEQLAEVEKQLTKKRGLKEDYSGSIKALNKESNDKNLRRFNIQFGELTEAGINAIELFREQNNIVNSAPNSLTEFETLRKEINGTLKSSLSTVSNTVKQLELDTTSLINLFVNPSEKIYREFPEWSGDVMNIEPSLKSLDELEDLYNTIRNHRLVDHKRRFTEYMDRSMLDALTNFRTWLYNEEDRIKEVITELNIPLKKITFNKNPDTYLQLECRQAKEPEIKAFREQLSATIPNTLEFATQKDEGYRQQVFDKIKALITELQKEEMWRRRVTDARNWLIFNAREYSMVENKAGEYHDNTASYSGGQKAQFTYAILGAAISHQFGIYQEGKQHKSLRFITVDEAFSKLDPEKSRFLMEFCAQLNLQLLVVTPLDKINIAEPYIHAVHFVEIKNKKNSVVYNLTMEDYQERKEEFQQLAKVLDDNT